MTRTYRLLAAAIAGLPADKVELVKPGLYAANVEPLGLRISWKGTRFAPAEGARINVARAVSRQSVWLGSPTVTDIDALPTATLHALVQEIEWAHRPLVIGDHKSGYLV